MKIKTRCTECFKGLSVKSRGEIYHLLQEKGRSTVNEIVNHIKLKQPTISYHLKEMEKIGLLKSKKQGREVHYSVNNKCPWGSDTCILKI